MASVPKIILKGIVCRICIYEFAVGSNARSVVLGRREYYVLRAARLVLQHFTGREVRSGVAVRTRPGRPDVFMS